MQVRNFLFDRGIIKSASFPVPVIGIGNLSTGGTGKTPHVEYLIRLLQKEYKIATLSRGYGRHTKGFLLLKPPANTWMYGDEPMQYFTKFPGVRVSVGEDRTAAIEELMRLNPKIEIILMDDAFQHRSIKAGLNILLTEYNNLFTRDFYLPTGDLRDLKSNYKRAEIIVVTKCKSDLSEAERQKVIKEISPVAGQQIFFTAIEYGQLYHIVHKRVFAPDAKTEILLVTGIANPRPLKKMLEEHSNSYHMLQYTDHHIFTIDDLNEIKKRFEHIETANKIILTTEKDAVRLAKFNNEITGLPLYVIPVRHQFLFGDGERFDQLVMDFIQNFKQQS